MSVAAETYVKSLRHPKVKGGTRAVLDVIAQLIPEGETTTPLIAMQDIATPAGLDRSTVWRLVEILVGLGLLQVLDRASGRKACYHLVELTGATPITTAPLPLVGAAAPRRPRPRRAPSDATPGLFDEAMPPVGEEEAINLLQKITGFGSNLLQKITGSPVQPVAKDHRFSNLLQKITGWTVNLLQKPVAKDHRSLPQGVPIAEGATTYVQKELVEKPVVDARARDGDTDVEAFIGWFEQTYPSVHHGAVCTVHRKRDGPIVRELLQRPRTDVARLQAMTRLLWSITDDGVEQSNRWWIAVRVKVRDIPVLRWKANYLDGELTRLALEESTEDIWLKVLRRIEAKLSRDEFHTWVLPLVVVQDGGDLIRVGGPAVHVAWVQRHHGELVRQAVEAERPGARVDFVIDAAEKYG